MKRLLTRLGASRAENAWTTFLQTCHAKNTLFIAVVIAVIVTVLMPVLGSCPAQAGLFTITNRNYGNAPTSAQPSINAIFNALEDQVNSVLPNADATTYLLGIANSSVISADGVGADYATQFNLFDVGLSLGLGAALNGGSITGLLNGSTSTSTVSGFAGQYSVMVGIHPFMLPTAIGPIHTDRLKLFVNFMSSNFSKTGSTIKFSSMGLNALYNVIPPVSLPLGFLRWNGLDVTSGFRASSMNVVITRAVNDSSTGTVAEAGSPTVTTNFKGTLNVGADVHTYAIPIEVSTSARAFYIFSPYAGLGTDISFGSATSIANLSGPITVTSSSGALGTISGTGTLNLGQSAAPQFMDLHYFVGLQAQLAVVGVFFQYNQTLTNDTSGLSAGLHAYW